MPDMLKKYREEVTPELMRRLGCKNKLEVPKLVKIVINTGISSSKEKDAFTEAKHQLALITGQAPVITKSRKNVANFKLRKGMSVGAMVTLRGSRMYEFFDRLVHIVTPRIRDFRGVPKKGFDKVGNYNMGMPDISVFTEVDLDKMKYPMGIQITFVTNAGDGKRAFELLKLMEMPFGE